MKNYTIKTIILVSLIFSGCGFYNNINKALYSYSIIIFTVDLKITSFEESLACFYDQNSRFPQYPDSLNHFMDTTKAAKDLFSKFQEEHTGSDYQEYSFELEPFTLHFNSYSEKPIIDSIKYNKAIGKILYSDSLISDISDTLLFKFNFSDLEGIVYTDNDSLVFNHEDVIIGNYLKKLNIHKIPYKNICKE